jgi:hypothetical protein
MSLAPDQYNVTPNALHWGVRKQIWWHCSLVTPSNSLESTKDLRRYLGSLFREDRNLQVIEGDGVGQRSTVVAVL